MNPFFQTTPPAPELSPLGEVSNWEEINCWATHNNGVWRAVGDRCSALDVDELSHLRLLAAAMLALYAQLQESAIKELLLRPQAHIILDTTTPSCQPPPDLPSKPPSAAN